MFSHRTVYCNLNVLTHVLPIRPSPTQKDKNFKSNTQHEIRETRYDAI